MSLPDTATVTPTVKSVLNKANIANLAEALARVAPGTLLEELLTPVTEELTLGATLKGTLAKHPFAILSASVSDDGGVAKSAGLMRAVDLANLGDLSFHVDEATRVCTFVSYQESDAAVALAQNDKVKVRYIGLTLDTGLDGPLVLERLAEVWGR